MLIIKAKDIRMAVKKKETKVSLNIKISEDIDARLKRARAVAREQGGQFNVSKDVESFLLRELKKVEKSLGITQDIKEYNAQMELISKDD